MPERTQQRVGQRGFVPGPVVAAAIDEECRREGDAARACARDVGIDALRGAARAIARGRAVRCRQREFAGHVVEIRLGEFRGARHQGNVRLPELLVGGGALGEIRRAAGDVAAGQRPLPEGVAQPVAEAVPHGGDALVGGAAVRAGIAAVLDEGDLGARGTEHVVVGHVHRTVESIVRQHR